MKLNRLKVHAPASQEELWQNHGRRGFFFLIAAVQVDTLRNIISLSGMGFGLGIHFSFAGIIC